MNEHRETPKYSFSEKMDSTSMSSKVYFVSDNTSHTVVDPTPLVPLHESNNTRILLYDEDTADRILSMTTTDTEERTKPFLQRVQLIGPDNGIVRATGQVDNGAMKNCISKHRWERYGHCLSPLLPSKTRISTANGVEITPLG